MRSGINMVKILHITGKAHKYKAGNRPVNWMPIGSERISHGYVYVKVAEGQQQWRAKHRLLWEEAYGPIPKGHIVTFLDGNNRNFSLNNLIVISRTEQIVLIRLGLRSNLPEIFQTALALANTRIAVKKCVRKLKDAGWCNKA